MDIVKFTNKFHQIEIENNFFALKNSEGLLFWDVIRSDLFELLYSELVEKKTLNVSARKKSIFSTISSIFFHLIDIFSFQIKIIFKRYNYICYVCSRNKIDKNTYIDIASADVLNIIKNESLIIESFYQPNSISKEYKYYNSGLLFAKIKERIIKRTNNINDLAYLNLVSILKKEFNVNNFNPIILINTLIANFYIEYKYYLKLIKKVNPNAIFVVQNGIQKGMFAAAKKFNIPLIELQHGFIGYVHSAYSYPKAIKNGEIKTLPEYFLSFSDFWTKDFNYPVKKIVEIGNTIYSNKISKNKIIYELTIIFADVYTSILINFVDDLILNKFNHKICLKLHPNQYNDVEYIRKKYSKYSNIDIIYIEKQISEVLSISSAIMVIQSTCAYEALNNGIKVFILKKMDYGTHQNIFNDPNVVLIDSCNQIIQEMKKPTINDYNKVNYFKKFEIKKFTNFIEDLIK